MKVRMHIWQGICYRKENTATSSWSGWPVNVSSNVDVSFNL